MPHTVQNVGKQNSEMDTFDINRYLQAVFSDRWIDWGVSVVFLSLIASWFLMPNAANFVIDVLATGVMLAVAVRIGYVIACVRLGRKLHAESSRAVRFRETVSLVVAISFVVIAVLLIVWRYLR